MLRGACVLTLLVLTACRSGRVAADLIHSDFATDPRQQGWVCSDWNLATQAVGGWSADGYLALSPGYSPFWVSPQFLVPSSEFFCITVRSRGSVGLCGVGYNLATTWGRYPHTNSQGLLAADDWTVMPAQPEWQTNHFCTRSLANAATCGIRLSGGEVDEVRVTAASRAEVRAWADATYAAMPPLHYTPARDRFAGLSRIRNRLQQRQEVTVVLLGDSLMNDTCNSTFDVLLERTYGYAGNTRVHAVAAVGGGAGVDKWAGDANWNWPRSDLDLQAAVVGQRPDLVVIGGISNGTNYAAFEALIDRIVGGVSEQFGYTPDILLVTGAFGTGLDPAGYADQLRMLAEQRAIGFMDLRSVWLGYVTAAEQQGVPRSHFYRDAVHANHFGKQMLGRALVAQLGPDPPRFFPLQRIGDSVQVRWETEPGAAYSLWSQAALGSASWTLVNTATATTDTMCVNVDPSREGEAYYRVSSP